MIHIAFLCVFFLFFSRIFMVIEFLTRDSHICHLIGGTWYAIDKMNSVCECIYKFIYVCVCVVFFFVSHLIHFNHVQLINGLTVSKKREDDAVVYIRMSDCGGWRRTKTCGCSLSIYQILNTHTHTHTRALFMHLFPSVFLFLCAHKHKMFNCLSYHLIVWICL